jgi:hypothetical protein
MDSIVMAAEPEDVDPETSDDSADVNLAHVNVQVLGKTSDSFDVAAFNAATAKSYCEKADVASVVAQSYSENADKELVVGEACTWKQHMAKELESMVHELALGEGDDDVGFRGIAIDTCCTIASVCSDAEYRRYCRATGNEYSIAPHSSASVKFGKSNGSSKAGRLRSMGKAVIRGYLPDLDIAFSFKAHIMPDTDTPLLTPINDLDALNFDLSTLHSQITVDGKIQQIEHDFCGKPVIKWDYAATCFLTDVELRRLHRGFGHRSVDTVMRALEAADFEGLDPSTRRKLQDIAASCDPCQRNAARPRHFSISGRHGGRFNHLIEADVMALPDQDGNAIHVTCVGTGLNAARVLTSQTAEEVWKHIRQCWMETYLGSPDILRVDQDSNLSKSYIQTACINRGIELQAIPTEAA